MPGVPGASGRAGQPRADAHAHQARVVFLLQFPHAEAHAVARQRDPYGRAAHRAHPLAGAGGRPARAAQNAPRNFPGHRHHRISHIPGIHLVGILRVNRS